MTPTPATILFLLVLCIGWAVYDYLYAWPHFVREVAKQPHSARIRLYKGTLVTQWSFTVIALMLVIRSGAPLSALMLRKPTNLLIASVLVVAFTAQQFLQGRKIARSEKTQTWLRGRLEQTGMDRMVPHNYEELRLFTAIAITAGICEEILFRGFVPGVLQNMMGWWPAYAVSVVVFGCLHAYQGRKRIVVTAGIGVAFTLIMLGFRSLWPGIVLHIAIDVFAGVMSWRVYHEHAARQQQQGI